MILLPLLAVMASLLGEARAALDVRDYEEAARKYRLHLAENPADGTAWMELGRALGALRRQEEAVAAYDKAVALAPEAPLPRIGRARALAHARRFQEALQELEPIAAAHPDSLQAWWALGDVHLWAGDPRKAVEAFSRGLILVPQEPGPRIARARAYARLQRYEEALNDLRYVTAARPGESDPWAVLGDVQVWAGDPARAADAYTRCLEISPENHDVRISRARILIRLKRPKDAREDLKQVLDRDPARAEAWTLLGDVELLANDAPAAVKAYTRALDAAPADTAPRIGRARAHARGRQYPEALQDAQKVIEEHPQDAEAWSVLGNIHFWMGEPERAEGAFSKSLALRPGDPETLLGRARARNGAGRPKEALDDLGRAEALSGPTDETGRVRTASENASRGSLDWKATLTHSITQFSRDRDAWRTTTERIQHSWPRGSLALESIQARRFGKDDQAFALDAYVKAWRRGYANLRYQAVESPEVLPRGDYLIEPFQGFGTGWEGSIFYRHMDFTTAQVDLYGVSISKQLGAWYLRNRVTLIPSLGNLDLSNLFQVRRYFGATQESYVEVLAGEGFSKVTVGPDLAVERRRSSSLTAGLSIALGPRTAFTLSTGYQDEQSAPVGRTITLGFSVRW